jgi:hypothetical protein
MKRLAVFAECVLTGLWLTLAALPLVTALPALAAACAHLRRFLQGYRADLRGFAADVRTAWRGSWPVSLAGLAALALLGADVAIARQGLPGGPIVTVVTGGAALILIVIGFRAAAAWSPGASWPVLVRAAAGQARADLGGSALLACGLVVAGLVAWRLPPLLVPALGCLAAAALAVHARHPH